MEADVFHRGLLHPKYWLTWFAVFIIWLFSLLPSAWRRSALTPVGKKIVYRSEKRLNIMRINLRICFPDLSEEEREDILLQHAEHVGFAFGEVAWAWFRSLKRIKSRTRIEGMEYLQAAQATERPIILLLPHMLYLDYAVANVPQLLPCAGIFNSFKNPVLDWLVANKRGKAARYSAALHPDPNVDQSLTLIRRQDGGTIQQMIKRANNGFAIVHLMDEDLGAKRSVFAPFFGIQKATLANMSTMLRRTNAVIVPMGIYYQKDKDQYVLQFDPMMDLKDVYKDKIAVSTAINQAYEVLIKRAPEQYMWKMTIFRSRPEDEDQDIYNRKKMG